MLAAFFGVLAGSVIRAAADLRQAPGRPAAEAPDPWVYVFSLRFLVMIALGLLGGATVYERLYANEPAADLELFSTLLPLAGAAFAATLAAKSLADFTPPTEKERKAGGGRSAATGGRIRWENRG